MDIYSQIFRSREAHPLYTVTPVDAKERKHEMIAALQEKSSFGGCRCDLG